VAYFFGPPCIYNALTRDYFFHRSD